MNLHLVLKNENWFLMKFFEWVRNLVSFWKRFLTTILHIFLSFEVLTYFVSLLKPSNETFLKNTKRLTHILWHFKNENYQVNTQRASYRKKRYILKKCVNVTIQCNWPTKFQILIANRPGENCLYRSKIARAKCHQIATK